MMIRKYRSVMKKKIYLKKLRKVLDNTDNYDIIFIQIVICRKDGIYV